jgi:murein DD-endopeptidase MepM/ murein hydrolase activator NlpD
MAFLKCRAGFIWALAVSVPLAILPRYYESEVEPVPLPHPPVSVSYTNPEGPQLEVVEGKIRKNTTLVATLVDYDVPVAVATDVANLIKPVFDVRKILSGNLFRLKKETDGTLHTFEYVIDEERILKVEREAEAFEAKVETLEMDVKETFVTAEIESSLWLALAPYPKGEVLTDELAKMFAWDLDFNSEVQRGDQIRLVVDEYYYQGKFVKYGRIQAAELVNAGRTFRAFLFKDAYYDDKGNALKRSWLASPLPFSRITSGFSRRRMHPILGRARAHLAVDYGAPTGTPVQAVANGTVTFAGWNGGYGRLIQIRHTNGLTTGYAHLSRITTGIRKGTVVKQGQLIGAVGKTGLATGPHLHYMMTRGGTPINPLSMKSEPPVPIAAAIKPDFLNYIAPRQLQLQTMVVPSSLLTQTAAYQHLIPE